MSAVSGGPRLAFSVREVSGMLGISKTAIYDLIKLGEIRSVMIGGNRRIPTAELLRLLRVERLTVAVVTFDVVIEETECRDRG